MVKIRASYLSRDDVFQLGRLSEQTERAWPGVTVALTELEADYGQFRMGLVFMGDDTRQAVTWFRSMMTNVRWYVVS